MKGVEFFKHFHVACKETLRVVDFGEPPQVKIAEGLLFMPTWPFLWHYLSIFSSQDLSHFHPKISNF